MKKLWRVVHGGTQSEHRVEIVTRHCEACAREIECGMEIGGSFQPPKPMREH
jgi:hypothetical protein